MSESSVVRSACNGACARRLEIALVNNMPDAALEGAERQFRTRLHIAAEDFDIRLSLFTLPEIARAEEARSRIQRDYLPLPELWDRRFDGIIVTGAEPRAPGLEEETYWQSLATLIEWAGCNTYSAIWSCLAAHAAVLHLDGIARRRLPRKLCGVFECAKAAAHPLFSSVAERFPVPHSRWNGLSEADLAACGYIPLSASPEAGIDSFAGNGSGKSLFLFFQGHPEYEAETLLLEYRRDIGRFLNGQSENYPSIPRGYFDRVTTRMLAAARERALRDRRAERLAGFPTSLLANKVRMTWDAAAGAIYRNWLAYLWSEKERRSRSLARGKAA